MRFAAVAYRDYEDVSETQGLRFTEDAHKVQKFLSHLGASGRAADICEDVAGC